MKDVVHVVRLNDFEIEMALRLAPELRKLGRGYRWKHDEMLGNGLKYRVEEVTEDKIILTGQFGGPKFRLVIKDNNASFSTVGAISPEAIFYDVIHIIMGQHSQDFAANHTNPAMYDIVSTDPNDYYIMSNKYTGKISEYFKRVVAAKKDLAFLSGMFYLETANFNFGSEKLRALVKEFAEKSLYDDVAINFVRHRGHCVPIFYGNGAIFCPIAEKDYFEAVLEDFTRIFMKLSAPQGKTYDMRGTKKDGGFDT